MTKTRKSSEFWEAEYTKENIIQWFKNYISFYPDPKKVPLELAKKEFLEGEQKEIEYCIIGKLKQKKIYIYVEHIISEIKESDLNNDK